MEFQQMSHSNLTVELIFWSIFYVNSWSGTVKVVLMLVWARNLIIWDPSAALSSSDPKLWLFSAFLRDRTRGNNAVTSPGFTADASKPDTTWNVSSIFASLTCCDEDVAIPFDLRSQMPLHQNFIHSKHFPRFGSQTTLCRRTLNDVVLVLSGRVLHTQRHNLKASHSSWPGQKFVSSRTQYYCLSRGKYSNNVVDPERIKSWRWLSFGIWHHVTCYILTDSSKELTASIIITVLTLKKTSKFRLVYKTLI